MYQESIIENVKLIIQQTKFEALSHFVRPALPGEPLIVPGLLVGPDVYWLRVEIIIIKFLMERKDNIGRVEPCETCCYEKWVLSINSKPVVILATNESIL